ncbi:UDP-N-acetylglucosamine transporter yea4 [Penicillium sp. IBT 35674x]|nr:UDP-N-acetylglucosamine transporter yea4 [Penicillium sp. IBT 35674x]
MIHDGDNLRRRLETYKVNVSQGEATEHPAAASSAEHLPQSAVSGKLKDAGLIAAAAHATVPNWANMLLMISLIFGGCCANVFTLEAIIKEQSTAGPLITFAQFVLCAIFTLPHFLSFSAGPQNLFLCPRAIPLRSWLIYTAFFVSVNMLNNWAFAYKISVPLHIIIRSGGPVASMVVGYICNGRRYSRGQMLAVAMLTAGVVAAALADAQAKGQNVEMTSDLDTAVMATTIGFTILALAMVLSAFQGIYADRLYATYGRDHWKEALFYSHTLSLPLFITSYSQLSSQWLVVSSSPSFLSKISHGSALSDLSRNTTLSALLTVVQNHASIQSLLNQLPIQVAYLMMNALTQYLCIRGVHLLSAKSSSLTVTVVLNIRKLVSLLLSIYLFGNHLASGVLVGAILVFLGGGLYGFEGARLRKVATKKVQ